MKLGVDIADKKRRTLLCTLAGKKSDFIILNAADISTTIGRLLSISNRVRKFLRLNKDVSYQYQNTPKNLKSTASLLYDFVDAFIITGFDDPTDDIDPISELRLINDEYKPIYLEVPNDMLYEDLDELIDYSKLNGADGLIVSNRRLLSYATSRSDGILDIYMKNAVTEKDIRTAFELNVSGIILRSGLLPLHDLLKIFRARKRIRNLSV